MRDTLLGGSPGSDASFSRDGRELPRLRGGAGDLPGACGAVLFFVVFFFSFCVQSLQPNELGLRRNFLTGHIDSEVIRGGIHLTGPLASFVRFPAAQVTMLFAEISYADRLAVQTRTGADPDDPDSGGQPISISCAVQFQIVADKVHDVYLNFGSYEGARQRYLLLSGNMVSNTAQEFLPNDFWQRRHVIAERMLQKVNDTVWRQGSAIAVGFEILKVDFAKRYEDSITAIQVAEQQKVVNEYRKEVQRVVQSISVLKSETMAAIANVSAGAEADAKELCAHAKRDAFNLKQGMKAVKYAQLRKDLDFDQGQMQEYFKIKSIADQASTGRVVVGMGSVAEAVPLPPQPPVQEPKARPKETQAELFQDV